MFNRVLNMFRIPDLRNKILFTLFIIAVYRLGAFVPAPYVDIDAVQLLRDQANALGGILGFVQLFSGGALTQFAVFALGIMPYITASIIMQILGVVIPRIEQWQQQGAIGQRKNHTVDPLPDDRDRAGAVHQLRLPVPQRRAGPVASTCCPTSPSGPSSWWS